MERLWRIFLMFAVLSAAVLAYPVPALADESSDMIQEARLGVVQIATDESLGTGFGIGTAGKGTDIFLTNWHVVTDEDGEICDNIYILLDNADLSDESTMVRCKVLTTTTGYPDYAVIQAEREVPGVKALPLRASEDAKQGTVVYALGYPGATETGTSHSTADDITVTNGVVSKVINFKPANETRCIVHDAHINHGNSGGPLVTGDGSVVGLNTYNTNEDDAYSYAVCIDYAMEALDDLGIHYDVLSGEIKKQSGKEGSMTMIVIALAAVVIVALFVVGIILLVRKNTGGGKNAAGKAGQTGFRVMTMDGRTVEISPQGLIIGRNPACGLPLPNATVSWTHCRLMVLDGVLTLTDEGSSNGTYVGQSRLAPHVPTVLSRGGTFYLGERTNTLRVL